MPTGVCILRTHYARVRDICRMNEIRPDVIPVLFSRRRVRRLSVSVAIRRTLCAADVDLKPITCRSPPAGSAVTLPSARESVSLFCLDVDVVWVSVWFPSTPQAFLCLPVMSKK